MPALAPKEAVASTESRGRLVDALLQRAKKKNIKVEYTDEARQFGGGMFDRDTGDVKVDPELQNDHSILAHELGHAEFDKTLLGRAVQSPVARGLSIPAMSIGMIIAATATGNLRQRLALSTGVVAAGQLPLLTGEGVAWYKGHKMLKEHGASPEELAHLRSEALRLGSSYLVPGAFGAGGSMLLSAFSHALNP